MAEYSSPFVAGPGGIMTDDVGVITGELELRTVLAEDGSTVRTEVRYEGADEWYALTGGHCALKDPEDLSAVHELLVGVLNRPEG
ncbi:hypothetical protein [Umezawaea sp.]|uniref:hypothetical protein n=1 Tax=Umezawaea sp. TaxID=1955258 RepID=UPI002ED1026B